MLALLLACQHSDTKPAEKEQPLPYIYEEDTLPDASVDPAAVEAAAVAGLSRAMALRAGPVFPAYHAVMSTADGGCPNYYDYNGSVYWYDNCYSEMGTDYSGYSFYTLYDKVDDGAGDVYSGEALQGVAQVTTADGYRFEAGGGAYYYKVDHAMQNMSDTDYSYWVNAVQGSFTYDGPEGAGTWLSENVAPDLTWTAAYLPSVDGQYTVVDGSVGGLDGDLPYLVFDNLMVWSPELTTCSTEPGGGFSVRDTDGNWYDVTFDGPTDWGQKISAADCDGCGRLWFEGQELGKVCADFSAMNDWEGAPW